MLWVTSHLCNYLISNDSLTRPSSKRVGTMSFCSSPHPWSLAEYLEHAKIFPLVNLLKMTYARMLCLPGLVASVSLTPRQATVDPRLYWRILNTHRRRWVHTLLLRLLDSHTKLMGSGWRGRWEGGSGWGTHVNPWLFYSNVWQNSLQIKKKKKKNKLIT